MGRNKKTQKQKGLEGNAGKRDVVPEVGIELASVRVPPILSESAQEYWRIYAPLLIQIGSLTKLNVPTFIEYCRIRARLDHIHKLVDEEDSLLSETTYTGKGGVEHIKYKQAEYFKMMRQLSADSLRHERALKMSPDKMAGVYKPAPQKSEEDEFLDD